MWVLVCIGGAGTITLLSGRASGIQHTRNVAMFPFQINKYEILKKWQTGGGSWKWVWKLVLFPVDLLVIQWLLSVRLESLNQWETENEWHIILSCTTSQRSPGCFTFLSLGACMRHNLEVFHLLNFKFCSLYICFFFFKCSLWILAKDPLQLHEELGYFPLSLVQRYHIYWVFLFFCHCTNKDECPSSFNILWI